MYHLSAKSRNKKLGAGVAATTTTRESCPDICPLKNAGCYADAGPLRLHWDRVTRGETGCDATGHFAEIAALKPGTALRLNQAGDLPSHNGRIDPEFISGLIRSTRHLSAVWGYTHHPAAPFGWGDAGRHNRAQLIRARDNGVVINLSTDSPAAAVNARRISGLPVVMTATHAMLDSVIGDSWRQGRADSWRHYTHRFVVCPQTTGQVESCRECRFLCARGKRESIVVFPVHGTNARKAERAIQRQIEGV